ncbi:hypothetical protein BS50DRAFT_274342 [Corynespora cassiicola Philippines]|uniref:Uncharacterized protein n=1 Tax=Corynespora cassiicola Philippines TaxID=1448308 RepID=A0A2T2P0B3_CORCC|nr:hypothetical protein BS50DRAFT_274342 [Corynespora cassiicola Philippines]
MAGAVTQRSVTRQAEAAVDVQGAKQERGEVECGDAQMKPSTSFRKRQGLGSSSARARRVASEALVGVVGKGERGWAIRPTRRHHRPRTRAEGRGQQRTRRPGRTAGRASTTNPHGPGRRSAAVRRAGPRPLCPKPVPPRGGPGSASQRDQRVRGASKAGERRRCPRCPCVR